MIGFQSAQRRLLILGAVLLLSLLLPSLGRAGVGQEGDNTTTFTTSTANVYADQITPVTDEVDDYLTAINAQLADGAPVFTQTNPAPLSDPTVQAAIAAADAVLASDGEGFGAPTLESTDTTLQSSVLTDLDGTPIFDSSSTATTVYVGPTTFYFGDNQSEEFTVLENYVDYDTLTTSDYTVPVSAITTNTYLTTQSYLITGSSVPEPAAGSLLLMACAGMLTRRQKLSTGIAKQVGNC